MFAPDFRKVMNTAKTLADFESARKSLGDKIVGFVPTMGALHEGHASLIRRAVAECDAVVVSDFVNPTQFNNKTDFETYPRILDQDSAFVEALGAAVLFAPGVEDIYPAGTDYNQRIFDLGGLDQYGEGPRRPGHFNGMAHRDSPLSHRKGRGRTGPELPQQAPDPGPESRRPPHLRLHPADSGHGRQNAGGRGGKEDH